MVCIVMTGAVNGVEGYLVTAEIDMADGLPCMDMVGNLNHEVKETAGRVRVALKNSGYTLPPKRVTVNLSPAGIKKGGTAFDLPVAVGILASMGQIPMPHKDFMVLGELGLNGTIRGVPGILPILIKAKEKGVKACVVPKDNYREASYVEGLSIFAFEKLEELIDYLRKRPNGVTENKNPPVSNFEVGNTLVEKRSKEDFAYIIGQHMAKRGAEIAAAGFHNFLLTGPPGTGKSMIAAAMSTILPPMDKWEMLDTSKVYSVAGMLNESNPFIFERPYQSPHHTITPQALVGGGMTPTPGIISLANHGVLFLDELPEFKRQTLDLLRQPIEEGKIVITRKSGNYTYPSDFMLVAAMNPCPCGFFPDFNRCTCSDREVKGYTRGISGPLLNRFDLCVSVMRSNYTQLKEKTQEESSSQIRERVIKVREIQKRRNGACLYNGRIAAKDIAKNCSMTNDAERIMEKYFQEKNLSMRGYHRTLRVARTIADLDEAEKIQASHILEALSYRGVLDK